MVGDHDSGVATACMTLTVMDEHARLPGFSARQGEQEVHDVVCISDGDGLGARLAPGSFSRPLLLWRKGRPQAEEQDHLNNNIKNFTLEMYSHAAGDPIP